MWTLVLLRGEVIALRFIYDLSTQWGLDTDELDELIEDRIDDRMADIRARRLNPRTSVRRRERDQDNLEWLGEWLHQRLEGQARNL